MSDDLNLPVPSAPADGSTEPPPQLPAPRESPLREVFLGPKGLRSGTRLLIYVAMGFAIFFLLGGLLHYVEPHARGKVWLGMISELQLLLAAFIPGFVMARFENRCLGDYGLPAKHAFGKQFWAGMAWGIVGVTVLIVVLRGAGAFYFGGLALHGWRILKFAAYYGVFFLIVGFFEEFLLRGYTQFALSKAIDFWPTAAVLSFSFGAIHALNPGETKIGLVAAGLIGFFLCLTLRRTGDLWFAVGFHCSWDWGETYLYSVPNSGTTAPGHLLNSSMQGPIWLSGGSVGPEGSVLVFLVIAALWVLFDRMYPEVKYPS